MPTTSNFGWTTPADTDLVKDGAAAIRTLGNGIDTSFLDLKGGTTGQNLRKNSDTDLDFTFAGDDTNTVVDAAGDLLYGSAADTLTRLAIGTTGQVLRVNSGATAPEWFTPAGGGKVLQVIHASTTTSTTIASTTYTDTTLTATITPSSATSKILILVSQQVFTEANSYMAAGCGFRLMRDATAVYEGTKNDSGLESGQNVSGKLFNILPLNYLDSPNTTSAVTYKTQGAVYSTASSRTSTWQISNSPSNIVLLEIGA